MKTRRISLQRLSPDPLYPARDPLHPHRLSPQMVFLHPRLRLPHLLHSLNGLLYHPRTNHRSRACMHPSGLRGPHHRLPLNHLLLQRPSCRRVLLSAVVRSAVRRVRGRSCVTRARVPFWFLELRMCRLSFRRWRSTCVSIEARRRRDVRDPVFLLKRTCFRFLWFWVGYMYSWCPSGALGWLPLFMLVFLGERRGVR